MLVLSVMSMILIIVHAPYCIGTSDITLSRSSNFPHNLNKMQSPFSSFRGVSNKKLWPHNIALCLRAIQTQVRPKLYMRNKILASYCLGHDYTQWVIINGGSSKYPFKVWTGSKTFKLH